MTRLDEFTRNTYSQFGEDGCIEHIFNVIGSGTRVCVEFGAGDGLSCSNTAALWRDSDWDALLIEADAGRYEELQAHTADFPKATIRRAHITPSGADSITSHITDHGFAAPDLLSIDIDGDDYFIFDELTCRPRVVCIEFNPTIPPHIELRQETLGSGFGASLLSLIRVAQRTDYAFIGATYCNAFFVRREDAGRFSEYTVDPNELFQPGAYTYAATDYQGRLVLVGQAPPWQAKDPMVEPLVSSAYLTPATTDVEYIRRAFERLYGPAQWVTVNDLDERSLIKLLMAGPLLLCIDLTNATLTPTEWMATGREIQHYRTMHIGQVLAFVRK